MILAPAAVGGMEAALLLLTGHGRGIPEADDLVQHLITGGVGIRFRRPVLAVVGAGAAVPAVVSPILYGHSLSFLLLGNDWSPETG